jgi:hypothetical protein
MFLQMLRRCSKGFRSEASSLPTTWYVVVSQKRHVTVAAAPDRARRSQGGAPRRELHAQGAAARPATADLARCAWLCSCLRWAAGCAALWVLLTRTAIRLGVRAAHAQPRDEHGAGRQRCHVLLPGASSRPEWHCGLRRWCPQHTPSESRRARLPVPLCCMQLRRAGRGTA